MENKIMKYFLVGLLALLFVGCGAKKQSNIYCWDGTYAKSVYEYINQDGDINEQIANLENLIQKSYKRNRPVAPGIYAHLGLLYSNLGNHGKFISYLDKEAQLYPESKTYIEFLKKSNKGKKDEK
ncbi:DUF4810 domain-containing protein [Campylobacter ureolyticus]|jgi:lipoprotein|uniref:DUF4810 domain-containing protein n=2 Tax=Campylobacter ureolyticus TaxID=827 RepID=A0A9Q4PSG3_9BACT|nr:DUF4810 domain-containing protein [Campylobacter ureolyticus]MCZ6134992.1 DUF4810 domain-containing protein [Campylobacter ureolyticus]MCZ6160193.1 DUF4810 domain-containing protein [Campylobacter ureolyticus]MCZ6171658.1 DUF4810 domain-containing protein [Campylobacter ureolyticus]